MKDSDYLHLKNIFLFALLSFFLTGCVAGPPILTQEQMQIANRMQVFEKGNVPAKEYKILSEVEAADCSGPGGTRFSGQNRLAIYELKQKAAAINGDAVINVSCSTMPFVNNCWAAKVCEGKVIKWK